MLSACKKRIGISLTVILSLMVSGFVSAQNEITELEFIRPSASDSDTSRTLESLVEVRDISLYHPPGGFSSISFSRAIDMGFPLNVDLEQLASSELGGKLLLAPFYAKDSNPGDCR